MTSRLRLLLRIAATAAVLPLLSAPIGCHSAFVDATVINHTGGTVKLIEVDYPSASFGTQDLAQNGIYRYHFKVIGGGATKVMWTDSAEKDHTSKGPNLSEGQQGQITVTLEPQAASWQAKVHP